MKHNSFSAHSKKEGTPGLFYLKLLILSIFLFTMLSSLTKLINFINDSKLNGYPFNLLIVTPPNSYSKTSSAYIINLDKNSKKMSSIIIKGADKIKSDKISRFAKSIMIGLPIDNQFSLKGVTSSYQNTETPDKDFFTVSQILSILTSSNNSYDNLAKFDFIKMYLLVKTIPKENIMIYKTTEKDLLNEKQNDKFNKIFFNLFRDVDAINDKTSIEIINASGKNGAGTKFARMLTNIGYNVIGINSDDDKSNSKIIYRIKDKKSVERLLNLFDYRKEYINETNISDITIIIGKDFKY